MPISLLDGGTTTTAGGAAQAFVKSPKNVNNGYEYIDSSEPDFYARQRVVLTAREPSLQSDGSYSKHKASAQFVMPFTLASGETVYNVARISIDYHPESSAANIAELREMAAQLSLDAELDGLYQVGTLPV